MPINKNYNEDEMIHAVAQSLENFYKSLISKVNSLDINVMMRKNPYLFRAKALNSAAMIIDSTLSAFVSSSEETIFGNEFFEPIATLAANGYKALTPGVDIIVNKKDAIYAIAVKSGTSVFNSSSKVRQEQHFAAASKLAIQAKKQFYAIIGYSYGRKGTPKKPSKKTVTKTYIELAGQAFWEELTGDKDFYLKLLRYMGNLPEEYIEEFDNVYQKTSNRLIRDFTNQYCKEDGCIDWEKLVKFNAAK